MSQRIRKISLLAQRLIIFSYRLHRRDPTSEINLLKGERRKTILNVVTECVKLIEQCPAGWRLPTNRQTDPFTDAFGSIHGWSLGIALTLDEPGLVLELVEAGKRSSLAGLIRMNRRRLEPDEISSDHESISVFADESKRPARRVSQLDDSRRRELAETQLPPHLWSQDDAWGHDVGATRHTMGMSPTAKNGMREEFSDLMSAGVFPDWTSATEISTAIGGDLGLSVCTNDDTRRMACTADGSYRE